MLIIYAGGGICLDAWAGAPKGMLARGKKLSSLVLKCPVRTLDNEVLLPAGAVVSQETLEPILAFRRAAFPQAMRTYPFLWYGSFAEDLKGYLGMSPYANIFHSPESIAEIFGDMEAAYLSPPVFQALDYFKRNDSETYRHFLVVFALSALLAKDLFADFDSRIGLTAAGPTHDMGKFCVPLSILKKTTPLTRSEKQVLDSHPTAGYALLSYYLLDAGSIAAKLARDHHERNDGSGYPGGIRLNEPMVEIVAACDVYDALISPRPYRAAPYDNRTALEEITKMAERRQIGWDVVRALIARNRRSKRHFSESNVSSEKRGTPPPDNFHGVFLEG